MKKSKFWKDKENPWRYYHFTLVYHKWRPYDVSFLRYQVRQTLSQKWKHLVILSFYTSVPKLMIIGYTVLEIWCMTDVIVVFHFGQFLPFYPLNSPRNENIKKLKNYVWRYHSFTQVHQKSWLYATLFLRYGMWPM